jgi:hypothetical protein
MAEPESKTWPDWTLKHPAAKKSARRSVPLSISSKCLKLEESSYAFFVYQSALTGV